MSTEMVNVKHMHGNARAQASPHESAAEEALIIRAKSGDRAAYAELYRRHAKKAFHVVFRITKNREDAEDVLQEALVKALVHLKGFDGRSAFSTWLTRIAINVALMLRRKRKTHFEGSIERFEELGSSLDIQVPDLTPSAEDLMHKKERDRQVNRAIQRLPSILRLPIELQLSEELSVKELATRLGISVSATKSRLLRARNLVGSSMTKGYRSTRVSPKLLRSSQIGWNSLLNAANRKT